MLSDYQVEWDIYDQKSSHPLGIPIGPKAMICCPLMVSARKTKYLIFSCFLPVHSVSLEMVLSDVESVLPPRLVKDTLFPITGVSQSPVGYFSNLKHLEH